MLKKNSQSRVTLHGTIQSDFAEDSNIAYANGKTETIYLVSVAVPRLSGTIDTVPVLVSNQLIEPSNIKIGNTVYIQGEMISQYEYKDTKRHLKLRVRAESFRLSTGNPGTNRVTLEGKIVKGPLYRTTPNGRKISDMLISVYGAAEEQSYLFPCIAWGKNAEKIAELPLDTIVEVSGRIQSREYQKQLSDGSKDPVIRTTYEISADKIEAVN